MNQAYHILFTVFLGFPIFFCLLMIVRSRREFKLFSVPIQWVQILNSSIVYAIAFNLIFFWQELFLALGKSWLGLTAYLYHNNHGWEDYHELERLMQGTGALAILLLGILMTIIDLKHKQVGNWWRQLILWLGFHGMVQSLPQLQTAMLAKDTDTGQAMTYLGLVEPTGFIIAVLSTVVLVLCIRYFSHRLVWASNESSSPVHRFKTLTRSILIPGILGTILIFPFRIFPWSQIIFPIMIMVIYMPWALAFGWMRPLPKISGMPQPSSRFQIMPFIILIIMLAIFQGILAKGVTI